MKTKRIQVTLEITIPADWTIGGTEEWFVTKLQSSSKTWKSKVLVDEQRSAASCPENCPCRGESHSQRVQRLERERERVLP